MFNIFRIDYKNNIFTKESLTIISYFKVIFYNQSPKNIFTQIIWKNFVCKTFKFNLFFKNCVFLRNILHCLGFCFLVRYWWSHSTWWFFVHFFRVKNLEIRLFHGSKIATKWRTTTNGDDISWKCCHALDYFKHVFLLGDDFVVNLWII